MKENNSFVDSALVSTSHVSYLLLYYFLTKTTMKFNHSTLQKLIKETLMEPREKKAKQSFWASDFNKNAFDIYHKFKGTEPTNVPDEEKQIIFSAGKAMEESLATKMIGKGLIKDTIEDQTRVDMERNGIRVTGYVDAISTEDHPIEMKTIYHAYQDKDIANGIVNMNYLGQLCIYMDFLQQKLGFLVYMNRGTGKITVMEVKHLRDRKYVCIGNPSVYHETICDLDAEYERWSHIYNEYVKKDIEPESDAVYKYDIEEIDWTQLPVKKIGDARKGSAVVGDWGAIYSDYKDLIIKKEARKHGKTYETYIGYSDKELARIAEITKGYTTWKKTGFEITDEDRQTYKGLSLAQMIIEKTNKLRNEKAK